MRQISKIPFVVAALAIPVCDDGLVFSSESWLVDERK